MIPVTNNIREREMTPKSRILNYPAILVALALLTIQGTAISQETASYFKQNCISCHTIGGGRLTGPDLKNVTQAKDRAWLSRFIVDPRAMLDAGDQYALDLQKDARGAVMPALPGMTRQRAEALLDLIDAESKLEKSQFIGVQISDRPLTQRDLDLGRELFLGTLPLNGGGPSCLSCHSVHGINGLGGGTLAPDLTTVFERYGGRKTLAVWLSAPATPTMQSVFSKKPIDPDEILGLVAYFQHTLQRSPEDASTARLNFVLLGLAGTLLVLGLFDVVWNKRFRAVRRPLVQSKKLENVHE